jgi:tRNA-2-methylthio-N6-dimethylallyladenosine synthase
LHPQFKLIGQAMKYHLVTLGCQMNKSDSERVSSVIEGMGYQWSENEEDAELLGVIACSVRQKAIDKVYTRIHKWNKWKNNRNLVTFVSGCILPADREKFLRQFDIIFQINELTDFPEMLRQYGVVTSYALGRETPALGSSDPSPLFKPDFATLVLDNNKKTIVGQPVLMKQAGKKIESFWNLEPHYQSVFEAFVPIQNGCDKFCTFCAVPYTRGREISRPSSEIINEVKNLVEKGYKSITLLGQNVNSYGIDKKGEEISFPELLQKIGEYGDSSGKDFWLYFTSPHPRDMSIEVLETIAKYKCLAKQIHLPLQSGDDKVLIKMNRNHNINDYRKIVESIRKIIPAATLFTDIIVGFTGETEEQFLNTFNAMDEFRFNMAYIARYSPRPGAASSRWDDDIAHAVKKDRLHRLSELLQKHSHDLNRQLLGKTCKVLVIGSDRKGGFLSGHTEGKIIVRFASSEKSLIGKFVDVKIDSVADFASEGNLVKVYNEELSEV